MTKETYLKASKLWGKIVTRKGYITTLHNILNKTKDSIKIEEIENKIHENVLMLANLRKEFEEI